MLWTIEEEDVAPGAYRIAIIVIVHYPLVAIKTFYQAVWRLRSLAVHPQRGGRSATTLSANTKPSPLSPVHKEKQCGSLIGMCWNANYECGGTRIMKPGSFKTRSISLALVEGCQLSVCIWGIANSEVFDHNPATSPACHGRKRSGMIHRRLKLEAGACSLFRLSHNNFTAQSCP